MCGILGVSHLTDVTRTMIGYMAWEMEERGQDSWGATDGRTAVRRVGPVTATFWEEADTILGWDRCILHTRGASYGEPTEANAHPFHWAGPGGEVLGIHNGIVSNHLQLDTKYGRTCAVDSMHIFAHLAEGRGMEDVYGWGNIAWYARDEQYPDSALRLVRFNSDAMHVAKLVTGEIVFCSTKNPILRAAAMAGSDVDHFFETKEETVYRVGLDGDWKLFVRDEKMRFGTRTASWTPPIHQSHTPAKEKKPGNILANLQSEERRNNMCMITGCAGKVHPNRRSALVCEEDMKIIREGKYRYGGHRL